MLMALLVVYGATLIVTQGRIFERLRAIALRKTPPLGRWLRCSMCFGFTSGVFWRLAGLETSLPLPFWLDLLAAGCAGSAVSWILHVTLHRLGANDL